MLGRTLIQVSIDTFANHNSAKIKKAFEKGYGRDPQRNQIECYLDDMYGSGDAAEISENGRFEVKKQGRAVNGFSIIYIHGRPGKPSHSDLVKTFPDIKHIRFEEIKEKLFKDMAPSV